MDLKINELKGNQEEKSEEKENQEENPEKENLGEKLKENLGEKEESQGENLEDLKVTNHNCECVGRFY